MECSSPLSMEFSRQDYWRGLPFPSQGDVPNPGIELDSHFWERWRAGGEGDDRGWDGWMASPTQWTWVWVGSGSRWWTGRPGMLRFMGSQRVRHDLEMEQQLPHCRQNPYHLSHQGSPILHNQRPIMNIEDITAVTINLCVFSTSTSSFSFKIWPFYWKY